ncbi:acetyl-CoA carboxylase biotin carboxyl carrier protein [Candidatus Marinarcus aquaticus]|uniref:Biotin carboxyl carrier protein of acetyl-CoA carboxylase n=1 Tax=Candidatus Marinarcus aquaticus TaxID=2044504 RepID=A0A4Q0XV17_9BACT|nr:acetyl-CoA carboxylase biotin carboxyl carrier protein [Candidatus Marinarcus aquaticus]RXJ58013.1 acetyl-CoA carboxylase, biotin carboxyl carrier protein [Candidatus Marinarcus aquaticus]
MDFKEIKELIKLFDKSELSKLKVKEGEFEVSMGKGLEGVVTVAQSAPSAVAAPVASAPVAPVAAPTPAAEAAPVSGDTINAPMIGTYYEAPSPDSAPFVKVGDTVKAGQTLCILEAMKIMNEVEAEYDCKILKILVDDGEPVEYDMPLFAVEKI